MCYRWYLAGGAALSIVSGGVWADAAGTLIQIGQAARTQNFQGVAIYRDEEHLEALRVVHGFSNGHERERVTSLNGDFREVFREDDRVYCILPKDRMVRMQRPSIKGIVGQFSKERIAELANWYSFRVLPEERVAGRSCLGIAIEPRDEFRYGYQIWADQQTHVPLRISLLDVNGKVLEQAMFTEIEFPASIPDEAFKFTVNTAQFQVVTRTEPQSLPTAPMLSVDPELHFEHLPPGFRVVMHEDHDMPEGGGAHVEHTLLTDGLTAVSVFADPHEIAENGGDKGFYGVSHMGPVQAYGRLVGEYHVTVVGEVPVATIRMIGDGLRVPQEFNFVPRP